MKLSDHHKLLMVIASAQFIYVLDFMMLMPLGPDLAHALQFNPSQLGWLSAAYSLAALLAGIIGVRWLDRFARKPAFLVCLALLALCTLATSWAADISSLLLARALTGFCGAPLVALGMAILIDHTPAQQRGQAMAKVGIGFTLAAVAGVPLVLELVAHSRWQVPFQSLAGLALVLGFLAWRVLPTQPATPATTNPWALLRQPKVGLACALQAMAAASAFLIIPNFAGFFLGNLGIARSTLGLYYLAGGLAAMALMQGLGKLLDQRGPIPAVALASLALGLGLLPWLGWQGLPSIVFFVLFMSGNAARNVCLGAATSTVAPPEQRAGFMALQSMAQDCGIGIAALIASQVIVSNGHGELQQCAPLALLSWLLSTLILLLLPRLQPRSQAQPVAMGGQSAL